jgi:Zn finger protein HypA/HybF involved in hydrogenase expression
MSEIIDFAKAKLERDPHTSGEAICLHCRHTWQAVAPVAVFDLECPECRTMQGVWNYHLMPANGDVFVCNCGNNLFILQSNGRKMCPACGTYSDWNE